MLFSCQKSFRLAASALERRQLSAASFQLSKLTTGRWVLTYKSRSLASLRISTADSRSTHVRKTLAFSGGADRDRTGDPLLAKQVLSQLSYSPALVVSCQLLVVSGFLLTADN